MEKKTVDAVILAAKMLVEHGLGDWHLNIKNVATWHAETYYPTKIITYSSRFITVATKEQFMGATYHEIAHALVGQGKGHGKAFQITYQAISGNDDYRGSTMPTNASKFLTECPSCNTVSACNSNRGRRFCGVCFKNGKIQRVLVEPNPMQLVSW